MTPGDAGGGNPLDLENDAALEIARRLVAIASGRTEGQNKVRHGFNLRPWSLRELAATYTAGWITRPAGAATAASCGVAIAVAELSGSAFGAIPGAVFDAALASVLLILFAWRPHAASGRLLPVLALVALIRPISLAAVLPELAPLAWYALAGVPLLVGAALATRLLHEPARELHLRIERPRLDAATAATGILAGLVGFFVLSPTPLLAHPSTVGYAAMVAILVVFGGVLEELIFRGLVQSAAIQTFGGTGTGVVFTAVLSMAFYWGSGSIPYMLLMAFVGCAFGLALLRGASLWGIALSHGLMLVTIAILAQGLTRQT